MSRGFGASDGKGSQLQLHLRLKRVYLAKLDGIAGFYSATIRCGMTKDASPDGSPRPPTLRIASTPN